MTRKTLIAPVRIIEEAKIANIRKWEVTVNLDWMCHQVKISGVHFDYNENNIIANILREENANPFINFDTWLDSHGNSDTLLCMAENAQTDPFTMLVMADYLEERGYPNKDDLGSQTIINHLRGQNYCYHCEHHCGQKFNNGEWKNCIFCDGTGKVKITHSDNCWLIKMILSHFKENERNTDADQSFDFD